MNLLILVALLLLSIPSLSAAQTFPGGSVPPDRTYSHRYSGQDHTTSITAIPLAPNFTVYQGSDGSSTTVIQTTPTMQSYFSHDKYGREQSGIIISPYTVKPAEPFRSLHDER